MSCSTCEGPILPGGLNSTCLPLNGHWAHAQEPPTKFKRARCNACGCSGSAAATPVRTLGLAEHISGWAQGPLALPQFQLARALWGSAGLTAVLVEGGKRPRRSSARARVLQAPCCHEQAVCCTSRSKEGGEAHCWCHASSLPRRLLPSPTVLAGN